QSRFKDQKVKKPKNVDIGERIVLDDERCIMCSRCIRFCDEIAEDDVLGFTERGSYTTLTTHPGKRLDNNYSLNTVDICPVGALTSKDFRFQMRTWFLKETKSIDVNCGTGANITVHSRENKVYRVTPRQNDAVNSCWMPDSHRLGHHEIASPLRLTDPLLRRPNGEHDTTQWNTALGAAAAELRNLGGEKIAIVASGRMTNEELFMAKRLAATLGVPTGNIDIVPRTGGGDEFLISDDRNPNTEGAKTLLGIENPGANLASIRGRIATGQLAALVTWGENLLSPEAGFSAHQLRGLKLHVAAFTLANPTAILAHVVLPVAMAAENLGSMINVTGRLQRLDVAVVAPGEARDDWEVLRDLTAAVGGGNGLYLIEDVFKSMASENPKLASLSLGKIGDHGIQLYQTGTEIPLLAREAERRSSGVITG
ncbi:MAG: molybdopterin-dependent oxidoreductase, partial [Verrucomicrobiales bacterium]|nr:molybdopterin-dependent oxidoreductase [Verrucomicrobiales bacterium]